MENEKLIIERMVNLEAMILSLKEIILDTPEKVEAFKTGYVENATTIFLNLEPHFLTSLEPKSETPL